MKDSFVEAEKIRAKYREDLAKKEAEKNKPKEETKAKLPDETVSSSKSEVAVTCSPDNPCQDGCAGCSPAKEEKPKSKKRAKRSST